MVKKSHVRENYIYSINYTILYFSYNILTNNRIQKYRT